MVKGKRRHLPGADMAELQAERVHPEFICLINAPDRDAFDHGAPCN